MKKMMVGLFTIVVVALCVTVVSCDDGSSSSGGVSGTYRWDNTADLSFELAITDGAYILKVDGVQKGTGTASKSGNTLTLTQTGNNSESLTVTVSGTTVTATSGTIYGDDGSNLGDIGDPETSGPGTDPGDSIEAYGFSWYTIDDATPNGDRVTPQTVFPPGGASRITCEISDAAKPAEAPEGPVFNFKGVTKVSRPDRGASEGAQFPMVGWEALPADAATLTDLQTAHSYSFWVRLNSSTANNGAFLTAVVTDFTEDKGYEYKHWFGNQTGGSGGGGAQNYTSGLTVGEWKQITVVLNGSDFNMEQDSWIHQWNPEYKGPFNQNVAKRIQWQIPLQHQVGAGVTERSSTPYDIPTGEYNFDLDICGFEFHL